MGQSQPIRSLAIVVENDEDERDLASVLFEESGYKVAACDSGEAALAVLRQSGERVAVLFTALGLPGMIDGVDLAHIASSRWPQINVLLTSREDGDRVEQLPDGTRHMAKPWRPLDVLVAAERAHGT